MENRFQYHPPKFDRGPLHPIQSPPSSDPTARNFVPGPFNHPRLKQTYDSTIASDLMTLAYSHTVPGTPEPPTRERLREWDGSSPYHKNRPRRGPRGTSSLDLLEKEINFRHIPEIKAVSISAFMPKAAKIPVMLPVARSVIQAVSGNTPMTIRMKDSVANWKVKEGDRVGVKTTMYGNQAFEFVDKLINLVLPKIKEWPGVKATTGDGNGNLGIGLRPEDMAWFPELAVNWDLYPARVSFFFLFFSLFFFLAPFLPSRFDSPFWSEVRTDMVIADPRLSDRDPNHGNLRQARETPASGFGAPILRQGPEVLTQMIP